VYGQQSRLQKYCKFFRKQHTIDKFDAVISQLDEHSEKAWQLADSNNHMPVRRRGVRASFSQGLQTTSVSAAADSSMFDSAECANNKGGYKQLLCAQVGCSNINRFALWCSISCRMLLHIRMMLMQAFAPVFCVIAVLQFVCWLSQMHSCTMKHRLHGVDCEGELGTTVCAAWCSSTQRPACMQGL